MEDSRLFAEPRGNPARSGAGIISRIHLENFMCHVSLQIEFGDWVNFITGQNGRYLPFEDRSLMNLYRKISRAEYTCPDWFTASQRKLISKMLDPLPAKRATIAEILEDEWFRVDYEPSSATENDENLNSDAMSYTMDSRNERTDQTMRGDPHRFINAFQLIAMSSDLDLSGLFHEQKTKLGSEHSIEETLEKIEVAAKDVSLYAERMSNSKVKLRCNKSLTRSGSHFTLSAEVFEVTPIHCVVEISKSAGDLGAYKEFCKCLSSLLRQSSAGSSSELQGSEADEKAGKELFFHNETTTGMKQAVFSIEA